MSPLLSHPDDLFQVIPKNPGKAAKLPDGLTKEDVITLYEGMVKIREYDQKQISLQRSGRIGFCVISTGEEAVQVGSAHPLQPQDWVVPYYRQHGIMLYRGVPLETMFNQLFGNAADICQGRQMPVHYSHKETRFVSLSSVIGTHMPHAVGIAMASQYKGENSVALTYIGDGGTSSNDFHSSLTFAGVTKAPVVFFIVNNQYAISLPVDRQCAAETLHSKGAGYGIPSVRVDGNDVFAVHQASKEAIDKARRGEGPTLIELLTYRAGPHSSSDDPTRYRSQEEMDQWQEKDPILRAQSYMKSLGLWSEAYENDLRARLKEEINLAANQAEKQEEPTWESLFDDVYADVPPALARQRDELMANEQQFPRDNQGEFPL